MHWEEFSFLGLRVCQPAGVERFGVDAILLSDFAARHLRRRDRVMDLCTGGGIVLLLLAARGCAYAAGVELYPPAAEAARENARINSLQAEIVTGDLRAPLPFPAGSFDLVTVNPPYFPAGRESPRPSRRLARSDQSCSFADAALTGARLLVPGGRFCAVYRPERLTDALVAMRSAGVEPKRLRFVSHDRTKPPFLFLIEGKKGARPGVIQEPLLTLDSPELSEIYAGRYHAT